jgi:hypothetical protein
MRRPRRSDGPDVRRPWTARGFALSVLLFAALLSALFRPVAAVAVLGAALAAVAAVAAARPLGRLYAAARATRPAEDVRA